MKSHIGPNGPSKCTAQADNCPYGESDNHFRTIAEAREAYTERLEQAYANLETVKIKKRKLTERENSIRDVNAKMAQQLVAARAENIQGITFEDADPVRAKRRLTESIEFAKSRHNENLVSKLAKATVLPSGAFKLEDGTRVNTDALLKKTLVMKTIEKERERLTDALTEVARQGGNDTTKFSLKTERGTYSLTVSEGVDEDAFERLSKKQRDACMSPKESLNMDLAREHLSPARLREITTETQVLDYVYGKEPDVGQAEIKASTTFEGKTTDEKLQSGLKNVAAFYDTTTLKHGRLREMKAYTTAGSAAIKTAVADKKTNTFIPARSQYNGALVSGRQSINPKLARELLTPEEIEKITVVSDSPDIQKAQTVLSPEVFDKIFKAKKVGLRVTEAKD